MVRQGVYAVYKGKEYALGKKGRGWINLLSTDKESIAEGFEPHRFEPRLYYKKVLKTDLEMAFTIRTIIHYKDSQFIVRKGSGDQLLIWTSNDHIGTKLEFTRIAKHNYEKWVAAKEVSSIYEEKVPHDLK